MPPRRVPGGEASDPRVARKERPMSVLDVIRAWKDPAYRHSLTAEQRALLPSHPAGAIELSAPAVQEGVAFIKPFSPCKKCHSTVGRK